ncbi:MAG TPA: hypothetical protein VGM51_04240 [Armatimonadota bacterium]|jgi:hypothetical protein
MNLGNLTLQQFNHIEVTFGAICTVAIYSLLWRENPAYRLFEYLFLGIGAAYGATRLFQDSLINDWWVPMTRGEWWWMVPFLLGLLYLTIYSSKLAWMARMLIGTLMGLAAGLQIQQVAITYFPQVTDSFRPLLPKAVPAYAKLMDKDIVNTVITNRIEAANNVVFFVTLVAVMTYFFFSFEHKGRFITGTAKLGRWLLMLSFGTMFGSTITARAALAVSRIIYVLGDALNKLPR